MKKYIESKYTGDRYAEIGFELTDSQKATIIWNKCSLTYNERLEEIAKIYKSTSDMQLKEQIKERIDFEEKAFARLKERNDENVVYVVKTADDLYGVFTKFDTALLQAKKIGSEWHIEDEIRIEKHQVITGEYGILATDKEVEMPNGDWSCEKQMAFERAMEAFSDYMSGNTQEENEKLVVHTAREYALACNKIKANIVSEGAKVNNILW